MCWKVIRLTIRSKIPEEYRTIDDREAEILKALRNGEVQGITKLRDLVKGSYTTVELRLKRLTRLGFVSENRMGGLRRDFHLTEKGTLVLQDYERLEAHFK